MKRLSILIVILLIGLSVFAQQYATDSIKALRLYKGSETYDVKIFPHKFKTDIPKNIILMIGDGMGVTHVYAGMTANRGHLFIENFKSVGFAKTNSASNYITDSAASGTALASGKKTYNGAIGVDTNRQIVKNIIEDAIENDIATGLVSTSAITHATPASFISHQASRNYYEAIAADFLKTDIDVFIGGGYNNFTKRKDGRNLVEELEEKGYKVLQDINKIKKIKKGKLAGLAAPDHMPRAHERGDMLPVATKTAINILDKDDDGFFLMVEGSQIDWAAHDNNTEYVVSEVLDFDRTIGEVLKFASKDGETLVIVTADHETGGFSIIGGNMNTGVVAGEFGTLGHTSVMVPVFAYGPGAEKFTGIIDNTDIHKKIKELLIEN